MVVLTDLIFFMQEQNGKYTFFSQDNKVWSKSDENSMGYSKDYTRLHQRVHISDPMKISDVSFYGRTWVAVSYSKNWTLHFPYFLYYVQQFSGIRNIGFDSFF